MSADRARAGPGLLTRAARAWIRQREQYFPSASIGGFTDSLSHRRGVQFSLQ